MSRPDGNWYETQTALRSAPSDQDSATHRNFYYCLMRTFSRETGGCYRWSWDVVTLRDSWWFLDIRLFLSRLHDSPTPAWLLPRGLQNCRNSRTPDALCRLHAEPNRDDHCPLFAPNRVRSVRRVREQPVRFHVDRRRYDIETYHTHEQSPEYRSQTLKLCHRISRGGHILILMQNSIRCHKWLVQADLNHQTIAPPLEWAWVRRNRIISHTSLLHEHGLPTKRLPVVLSTSVPHCRDSRRRYH